MVNPRDIAGKAEEEEEVLKWQPCQALGVGRFRARTGWSGVSMLGLK